jgi:hypothetical protein
MEKYKFNTVDEAVDDIIAGKMVILVDDEDRRTRVISAWPQKRLRPRRSISWRSTGGTDLPFSQTRAG